jgi:hypothetical protein
MTSMRTDTATARPYGLACAAGAAVSVTAAIVTQAFQAGTSVSTHALTYPWESGEAVLFYPTIALAQVLLALGVVGLRRSAATGASRAGAAGVWLALAGTLAIAAGDVASAILRHDRVEDGWAKVALTLYGAGTVAMAIGFLLAGAATLRAGVWRDWRRFAPLAIGLCAVALGPLQFSGVFALGIGVFSIAFGALGLAVAGPPAPFTEPSRARHHSAVL